MRGRPRKLSSAQIDQICLKRQQGWSYPRIAGKFGVSADTARYHCRLFGVVSPLLRRRAVPVPIDVLDALGSHAARRNISAETLAARIVVAVADSNIVDAVLDDAEQLDGAQ